MMIVILNDIAVFITGDDQMKYLIAVYISQVNCFNAFGAIA